MRMAAAYLLFINVTAFVLMGADKYKAVHRKWRIPERTLFASALLFGSAGALLGMYTFRHKTRHAAFVYGMPVILAVQLLLLALIKVYV